MSIIECLGKLYGVLSNFDRSLAITVMRDDGIWENLVQPGGHYIQSHIGVYAGAEGDMHIVYRSSDDGGYYMTSNFHEDSTGRNWVMAEHKSLGTISGQSLMFAAHQDIFLVLHRLKDSDHLLSRASFTMIVGGDWSNPKILGYDSAGDWETSNPGIFAWKNAEFCCFLRTEPNKSELVIWRLKFTLMDTPPFLRMNFVHEKTIPFPAAESASEDILWVAYQKLDHSIGLVKIYGDWEFTEYSTDFTSLDHPVICCFQDKVYLSFFPKHR